MGNNDRPQKIRVTFSRAYRLKYVGCGVLDRCFTHPMLPWVVGEIKRKGIKDADTILLEVTSVSLRAISCSRSGSISGHEELLFEHPFPTICKVAQHAHDKQTFAYLTRDVQEAPFSCHVFQATDEATVLELFATMRDMGKNSTGSFGGSNPALNSTGPNCGVPLVARMTGTVDSFSCNSQQFEVLYIGKIKVSHKRAPPSFIDEAVDKFKQHESERVRSSTTTLLQQPQSNPNSAQPSPTAPCAPTQLGDGKKPRHRHGSGSSVTSLPPALEEAVVVKENELQQDAASLGVATANSRRRGKRIRSHGDLPSHLLLDSNGMEEEEDESDDVSRGSNGSLESDQHHPLAHPLMQDSCSIHSLVTHTQSMDAQAKKVLLQDLSEAATTTEPPASIRSGPTLTVPSDSFVTHSQSLDIPGKTAILQDLQQSQSTTTAMTTQPLLPSHNDRLGLLNQRVRSVSGDMPRPTKQTSLPFYRSRVSSGGQMDLKRKEPESGHQQLNRAMLFLIGKLDLCLIGTDMKQVLLRKTFSDISHCCKGVQQSDHFGFICREVSLTQLDAYVGYVFRCQTKNVVDEIMQSLKQAFNSAHQAYQKQQQQSKGGQSQALCDACPMHWFHRLCIDLEGLPPDKVQLMILRRMKTLSDPEREDIMTKYQGAESSKVQEQNEIFMMLLRGLCEHKQLRHTHHHHQPGHSTQQHNNVFLFGIGKAESLNEKKGVSKFDNLREKAKKSLSNSFDSILKKRSKEDLRAAIERGDSLEDVSDGPEMSPSYQRPPKPLSLIPLEPAPGGGRVREGSWDPQRATSPSQEEFRPRSSTFSSPGENQTSKVKGKGPSGTNSTTGPGLFGDGKSPIMSIFMKVGNQNKTSSDCSKQQQQRSLPSTPDHRNNNNKGPWRHNIFQKVQTPGELGGTVRKIARVEEKVERTPQELRRLWKKAIMEQILLIRMENENKKLQVNQDAVSHKRMRLDYQEVTPCLRESLVTWEKLLSPVTRKEENGESPTALLEDTEVNGAESLVDCKSLTSAVREGVPRHRRGDIWKFLACQQRARWELEERGQWEPCGGSGIGTPEEESKNVPYCQLLKQLTPHQHAILIDLGRTFPSHPFFAQPLGAGQLSLFNLLKAYSLLDPLVGYCQGLSFVAGVLLLHMGEEEAFHLMRHVLFRLGFRKQYKPDMVALQIQMYQLSRLIHDTHREVYEHFEEHDIAPTLYAAPWFLTLFASQFPLGFVARLFDLIFLQGLDVVFKVALVLLGQHKESLLSCQGFEPVMDFLKNTLPNMGIIQMERLFNGVFALDISRQLRAYRVEYQVLQEELVLHNNNNHHQMQQQNNGQLNRNQQQAVKDDSKEQLALIKTQLQQQTESTKKAEHAVKDLKRENQEINDQLEKCQGRCFSLDSQMASYQSTVKRLETRLRDIEDERDALLHSVNVLRRRLEGYETPSGRRSLTGPAPIVTSSSDARPIGPQPEDSDRTPLGLVKGDPDREELNKAMRKLSAQMSPQRQAPSKDDDSTLEL